jgi:hypothetical protein
MGSLRDILLHQQMITEQNFPEGRLPIAYLQMLLHRENNLRAALNRFCEQIDIPRIKRKTMASLPKKLKPKDLKKTLRESVYDIKFGILAKQLKDPDFHRIRKQIKDLLYNFTHGKHMYGHGKKPRLTKKDEAFLGNMLLSLGRFQDLCSSLQILSSFSLESPTDGKENELLLVKQNWQKEKQALSIALTRQLKMFSTLNLNV